MMAMLYTYPYVLSFQETVSDTENTLMTTASASMITLAGIQHSLYTQHRSKYFSHVTHLILNTSISLFRNVESGTLRGKLVSPPLYSS